MEILKYPDPRLLAWNAPLGSWTPEAASRIGKMFKAMNDVDGIGLAAPQVGWNVRLFIMAIPDRATGETVQRVVFDPKIETSGELVPVSEGCLSFPGIWAKIKRWTRAHVVGKTPDGPLDEILEGVPAQAVQHEMDHLDGVLFIERMTPADLKLNNAAIRNLADQTLKKKREEND